MAIEAMNTAAAAYQGRVSNAANPKSKTSVKPASSETTAEVPEETVDTSSDLRLFEPVREEKGERKDYPGGGKKGNKQLEQAIEKFKKSINHQTEAVFGIHEGTNRVTIKIVDKESKDILKEYPPEQTLDMIQKVWEMAGIMVDEKL